MDWKRQLHSIVQGAHWAPSHIFSDRKVRVVKRTCRFSFRFSPSRASTKLPSSDFPSSTCICCVKILKKDRGHCYPKAENRVVHSSSLREKYHTNRFDGSLHQDLKAMNEGPPSPNLLCWRFAGVANTTAGPSKPSILYYYFFYNRGWSRLAYFFMTLENRKYGVKSLWL